MSDSILYLAIVGIWAGFLIPAWVRRPQSAKTYDEGEGDFEADADAEVDAASEFEVTAQEAYETEAEYVSDGSRNVVFEMDTSAHMSLRAGQSEYRDDVHPHSYRQEGHDPAGPAGPRSDGRPAAGSMPPAPGPSQSREQMMRARRRMLTILVGLVFITALFVMTGLVHWWICVPPIGMLVLYVALLREIAIADAELASKKRAFEARQAAAVAPTRETGSAWKQSHQAWEAAEAAEATRIAAEAERERAAPSAKIIDISSRVGDQLYDQYADAAVRAVGD